MFLYKADCLIAIATPRDFSGIDFMLRTFTWLHGEAGMAFLANKPILVFVQEGIRLEGLVASEAFPKLWFSPLGIVELYYSLPYVMPAFRQWIADAKREEFLKSLVDLVGKAGLGLLIGYALRLPPK